MKYLQWITILLVMLFLKLYARVLTTKELSQHVASHLHLHVHTHQLHVGSFEIISIFLAWPTMQKKAWEKHCCQSYRV